MQLTKEIAEIAGIHAGDGYLRYLGKRKELDISGNIEEKEYYDNHISKLFQESFNIKINNKFFKSRNTYGFVLRDKKVINLLKKLNFSSGKKTLIVSCPEKILKSKNKQIIIAFFDTDGSLSFDKKIYNKSKFKKTRHYYPRLLFSSTSKKLAKDFYKLLIKLEFKPKFYIRTSKKEKENIKYIIQLTGDNNLKKWIKEIKIKNPSKLSRYQIWEKFGFCPPKTTYKQRTQILKGRINPDSLYGPIA